MPVGRRRAGAVAVALALIAGASAPAPVPAQAAGAGGARVLALPGAEPVWPLRPSIDAAGRTLIPVRTRGALVIWRLRPGGGLDPSFGRRGRAIVRLGDTVNAVVAQPDGRLLLVGSRVRGFAVRRLTERGGPDPSFNGGRPVRLSPEPYTAQLEDAVALPDGSIVAVGQATDATSDDAAAQLLLVGLTATGAIDHGFGDVAADGRRTGYAIRPVGDDHLLNGAIGERIVARPDGSTVTAVGGVRMRFDDRPKPLHGVAVVATTPEGEPAPFAGRPAGALFFGTRRFAAMPSVEALVAGPDGRELALTTADPWRGNGNGARFGADGTRLAAGGPAASAALLPRWRRLPSFAAAGDRYVSADAWSGPRSRGRARPEVAFGLFDDRGRHVRGFGRRGMLTLPVGRPARRLGEIVVGGVATDARRAVTSATLEADGRRLVAVGWARLPRAS